MDEKQKSAKEILSQNDLITDRLREVALGKFQEGPDGLRLIIKELEAIQSIAADGSLQTLHDCLGDIRDALQNLIHDQELLKHTKHLSHPWMDVVSELINFFVFLNEEDERELRNRVTHRLVQLAKARAELIPLENCIRHPEPDGSWGLFDDSQAEQLPPPTAPMPLPLSSPSSALAATPLSSIAQTSADSPLASHYLICMLGAQQYALPIHQVREILEERHEKALPSQRPGILGLVTVRGLVCPVVDVSQILHSKDEDSLSESSKKRCMVVCEVDRRTFCFNVDDVKQVASVDEFQDQITPLHPEKSVQKAISHVSHFQDKSVLFVKMREVIPA